MLALVPSEKRKQGWEAELDGWWLQVYNNRMHTASAIMGYKSEES